MLLCDATIILYILNFLSYIQMLFHVLFFFCNNVGFSIIFVNKCQTKLVFIWQPDSQLPLEKNLILP